MSSPKFIFVTRTPDYFELLVARLDSEGLRGVTTLYLFSVCVCVFVADMSVFSLRLYELRQLEPNPLILYVIYWTHIVDTLSPKH